MNAPIFIDSDNAIAAPFGDIDDAFAIAAILKSDAKVIGLSSVFGNTFEPLAHRGNLSLSDLCGYQGKILRGARNSRSMQTEASHEIACFHESVQVLAIGPLTNLALALRENPQLPATLTELVFVATNFGSALPAVRFVDFNQWKDPKGLKEVIDSTLKLTCVPNNIARRLQVSEKQLSQLKGPVADYLIKKSHRWFIRALLMKAARTIPLWDLSAAMYLLDSSLFKTLDTTIEINRLGSAEFGLNGRRPLRVIVDYDPQAVWERFCEIMNRSV